MSSWMSISANGVEKLSKAGWWLVLFCIPFVQFLFFRWVWRLIIWAGFQFRLSQIHLMLQPSHPDKVGGLSILAGGQASFGIIFAAFGVQMSAIMADEILHAGATLMDVRYEIVAAVLISFAFTTLPMSFFSSQLAKTKRLGLRFYGALAYQLCGAFHTKWISGSTAMQGQELISAADPPALADYGAVYETISEMRWIPFNRQKAIRLALILAAPYPPLFLTQISIKEALKRLAKCLHKPYLDRL